MAQIDLNYVVWVDCTEAVFGPFSSEEHANLWAVNGTGGLAYKILRYVDLLASEGD